MSIQTQSVVTFYEPAFVVRIPIARHVITLTITKVGKDPRQFKNCNADLQKESKDMLGPNNHEDAEAQFQNQAYTVHSLAPRPRCCKVG